MMIHPLLVAAITTFAVWALTPNSSVGLERCVPSSEPLAWLGIRFALFHESPACAQGEVALGGSETGTLSVVCLVALPVLLLNLFALAVAVGLVRVLLSVAVFVGDLLRTIFIVCVITVRPVSARVTRLAQATANRLRPQAQVAPVKGRGPPVALAA